MAHEKYAACVDACNACANVCEWCASSNLSTLEAKDIGRCIALTLDCAEVCRLTANLLLRRSDLADAVCLFCVEACEACAKECRRHSGLHFERCVMRCQRAIQECWSVLRQRGFGRPAVEAFAVH